jgi:hypothetical protein
MPRITTVGPEARERLLRTGRGQAQLRPYLDAVASLSGDQVLELEPDAGESMRLIRVRLTRASRQLGKQVTCGATQEGTLLVWLPERPGARRRRRTPEQQPEDVAPPTPQEELPP